MKFQSLSALNALGGKPVSPGYLSFAIFVVDFLILPHEMGRSSYSIT